MLSEDDFTKYSDMLNNILTFKNESKTSSSTSSIPPSMGNVTDGSKLLKFLHLTIDDPVLKGKFENVYKIINQDTIAIVEAIPVEIPVATPLTKVDK
jgi:hypothetical protein